MTSVLTSKGELINPVKEVIDNVLKAISEGKRRIIIYGEPGSGRTTVIWKIKEELEKEGKKVFVTFASLEGMKKALQNMDEYDVILIDDADLVFDTEYEVDELTLKEIIEKANQKGKVVVISCIIDYKDKMDMLIHADFEAKIKKPNFEELRKAIISKLSEEDKKLITEKDILDIYKWSSGNLNLAMLIADIIISGRKKYLSEQ